MSKFIITTCLLMFWVFYEMSGGADFEPLEREVVVATPFETPQEPVMIMAAAAEPLPVTEVVEASFEVTPAVATAPVVEDIVVAAVATPPAPEPVATPVEEEVIDIRLVAGDWVNMRDGPSTDFAVLETLPRGTSAEIISVNDDGWAQIRLPESGLTGWMAERLLSES